LVHEINTPLSAILTRVRLALKQPNLPARTQEHLHKIEQECLEQIERFKLFFQATERDPQRLQLEPTALVTILKEKLPRWQEQVRRRGSHLDIEIPADLPNVVSDPQRLDTILSGMIDRVARISPPGSDIRIQVVSAGEQVKLQLQVKGTEGSLSHPSGSLPTQAIGQILVLQPETGAISLSIPVTQTLFRALGGYFTVRHRAEQGDVFTIYLPRQI
jgi:K+-sensing histidine kinase KdpD